MLKARREFFQAKQRNTVVAKDECANHPWTMKTMITETDEIPQAAMRCHEATHEKRMPLHVPYLGMGSSYFAALALKCQGVDIQPELASEYYYYLHPDKKQPLAVLISQSGQSSEVLWCREHFERYIAVVNNESSPLTRGRSVEMNIFLKAGEEQFTSSKTYINTLIALYNGHGIDTKPAIDLLATSMLRYRRWGQQAAAIIYDRIKQKRLNGITILGSGPNISTSYMGALGLQESARLAAIGLSTAEYDHGPKEAAKDSVVISVEAPGPAFARSQQLLNTARRAGATMLEICDKEIPERLTPITHIIPLFYLMHFLAERRGIKETFAIGGKVTETTK